MAAEKRIVDWFTRVVVPKMPSRLSVDEKLDIMRGIEPYLIGAEIVGPEGFAAATEVIADAIGDVEAMPTDSRMHIAVAREVFAAAGVAIVKKIITAHETIEGVYHSEDAFGTDRIETDSRLYFLDISDEYNGKRIAVHIEILEN